MPAHVAAAVIWGIIRLVMLGLSIHEGLSALEDVLEGIDKYGKNLDAAKAAMKKKIQAIEDEIGAKIEQKEEVFILEALEGADSQGPMTRPAKGRGADTDTIKGAIQQKIPFRKVIGEVCEVAAAVPQISLRRKKGVKISDLPKAKREALAKLLEMTAEQLADVKDIDEFIVVRLKQLTAALLFKFIDDCIDWKSPLKTEVSFGPPPGYADPPSQGTKLERMGDINPFYPAPHRQKGSIAADLVIPDYRKKPTRKDNIFAIVEIKFEGDKIDERQFSDYRDLLKAAAAAKTKASPITFGGKPVSSGGRLSLFRYPEDKAQEKGKKDEKPGDKNNDQPKRDGGKSAPSKSPRRKLPKV